MTSAEDISKMFEDESKKIENLFDVADSKTEMSIHEIVEAYYQVMNVSSMANMLKQVNPELELKKKISKTEKLISQRFDSIIHPRIIQNLSASIQELTKKLQSGNSGEKSKEQTELDTMLFDELRQSMSTKEFVEQYENGLSHD
ncbi:MAG: hypothetical protein OEW78_06595 [Nitrosopumilus sp.]|uniref:hypothetical protein n=1 Tax=Nitrosopumilus sp. TaxID=2024843 RepID=UPI00246F8BA9|nr:hypothetical protein [Nitrosopumilus sp.]MDH5431533.1 hypothetical protein [Nitrosopumilus sp.]